MLKNFLFIISILVFSCVFSQDEEDFVLIKPKHAYSISFALPVPSNNQVFKDYFQGFISTQGAYHFTLKNGLLFGAEGSFTYFQTDRFKLSPQITGGTSLINGKVFLGYEKFINERIGYQISINLGRTGQRFNSDSLKGIVIKEAIEFGTRFSFSLSAGSATAYQWYFAIQSFQSPFLPQDIGDNINLSKYTSNELLKNQNFFLLGMSYTHYFKKW